jgi:hypothetical protein
MREYTKAISAVQEATNHDSENQHTKEIQQQELRCQQALFTQRGNESQEETLQRAMRDPEVAVSQCLQCLYHVINAIVSGNYERPRYAVNLATSSGEPPGTPRPFEKSRRSAENPETYQCWYY